MSDSRSTRIANDGPDSAVQARLWRLFIDESGQFSDERSHVHCAALLVERDRSGNAPDAIKAELVRLAPEFTWPLHAAFLKVPAIYALSPYASGKVAAYKVGEKVLPPAAVVARLLASRAADTKVVLDSLLKGREPTMRILWRLDDTLREVLPHTHQALENRRAEISRGVRQILRALCRPAPGALMAAFLLLSVEEWVGAAVDPNAGPLPRESLRYDRLLRALFLLLDRTLSGRAQHDVKALVLTRHRSEDASREPLFVDRRHVESLVVEAIPVARDVRVTVEGAYAFDRHVHGGLVLADFVSTWALGVLRYRPGCPLTEVTELLRIETGLPVSSGSPPRSHIGCAKEITSPARSRPRQWASEARAQWEAPR